MTILEVVLPIVLFALIALLKYGIMNFPKEAAQAQVDMFRSQLKISGGSFNPGEGVKRYKTQDLIENFGEQPFNLCEKNLVIYYTSKAELRENVDKMMERTQQFWEYACTTAQKNNYAGRIFKS